MQIEGKTQLQHVRNTTLAGYVLFQKRGNAPLTPCFWVRSVRIARCNFETAKHPCSCKLLLRYCPQRVRGSSAAQRLEEERELPGHHVRHHGGLCLDAQDADNISFVARALFYGATACRATQACLGRRDPQAQLRLLQIICMGLPCSACTTSH